MPPLWTPLTSKHDRHAAFIENSGRCLNCGVNGHSLRHCDRPFTNTSGILNPELGRLNDNDAAFQTWLQRMRSYKQNQSRNTSSRSSNPRRHNNRFHHSPNPRQHGPHGNQYGHSDAQAERFRARHVTGYSAQGSRPALAVYQPNTSGGSSTSAVNHVMSNPRAPSGSAQATNRHRSPYSGRG